jgi:type IV secretory pathway VirB10-like protein
MKNIDIQNISFLSGIKAVLIWVVPIVSVIAAAGYAYKIRKQYVLDRPVIYQKGIDKNLFEFSADKEPQQNKTGKSHFTFQDIKDFFKDTAVPNKTGEKKQPQKRKKKFPADSGKKQSKSKKRASGSKHIKRNSRPVKNARKSSYASLAPSREKLPANLFQNNTLQPKTPDFVKKYNEKRRKAAVVRVSENPQSFYTAEAENRQYTKAKRWKNVLQDTASFPTDMKRVVMESSFIHALLIEAVTSELGGVVRASVQRNVYGSEGRFVLIPAGSKILGRYKPVKSLGQERIMIFWHRIVTPDGININTVDAEMTDQMGRAGITGEINRKYLKRYGMTFLISLLSAVASLNVSVDNEYQADVVSGFSKNMLDLTKEILQENMQNNKPVINIPAGTKIIVRITRDIFFREPEEKSVQIIAAERK